MFWSPWSVARAVSGSCFVCWASIKMDIKQHNFPLRAAHDVFWVVNLLGGNVLKIAFSNATLSSLLRVFENHSPPLLKMFSVSSIYYTGSFFFLNYGIRSFEIMHSLCSSSRLWLFQWFFWLIKTCQVNKLLFLNASWANKHYPEFFLVSWHS